jgi:hypothetical protein
MLESPVKQVCDAPARLFQLKNLAHKTIRVISASNLLRLA